MSWEPIVFLYVHPVHYYIHNYNIGGSIYSYEMFKIKLLDIMSVV